MKNDNDVGVPAVADPSQGLLQSIAENLWSQAKELAKSSSKKALDLNEYIDDTEIRLFKIMQEIQNIREAMAGDVFAKKGSRKNKK